MNTLAEVLRSHGHIRFADRLDRFGAFMARTLVPQDQLHHHERMCIKGATGVLICPQCGGTIPEGETRHMVCAVPHGFQT